MQRIFQYLTIFLMIMVFSMTNMLSDKANAASKGAYPDEEIELVVPFSAGGGTDRWARLISLYAADIHNLELNVKNRPGASAIVGWQYLLNQPADGTTVYIGSATPNISLIMEGEGRRIEPDEIQIVCYVSSFRPILLTLPDNEWADWKGFKSYVKDNPGELTVGGTTSLILGAAYVLNQLDMEVNLISYDSTPDVISDMLGGHIDVAVTTEASGDPVVPEEASPIFICSTDPSSIEKYQDVPSAKEIGADKGMVIPRWIGIHPDSPEWMSTRLSDLIEEVVMDERFQRATREAGEEVIFEPKEEAQESFADMIEGMKEAAKLLE